MVATAALDRNSASSSSDGGRGYVVRAGDTLSDIAAQHGVSLAALIRANPQIANPDLIRPGQYVAVPDGGGAAPASYTVRAGDTLSAIAGRFGLDWRDVASANGLADPNRIYPGQTIRLDGAGSSAPTDGPRPSEGPGATGGNSGDVLAIAQRYLGRNASDLKRDTGDALPMRADCPSNLCCANFVSAVLVQAGQLPPGQQTLSVAQLNSTLRANGWTPVSAQDARPGDVVIIQGGGVSHTEIYAGNGRMIGSNNTNSDGTQRVGYDDLGWALQKGAFILRAPDSVSGGGAREAGGVAGVDQPAATREGRIEQAVSFFEQEGWSRAQAIGIVANLDLESGMDWRIQQHGGGPGFGLAQWEGPRQRDFAVWAGKDIRQSSFAEQLRFIQHELGGSERAAGNALRGAETAAEAARIVCRLYERPANSAVRAEERADRADVIARMIGR